jgi:hypothetical protein
MIFWLVLKLEISYRVIISWRILVSFGAFFESYILAWWNIRVSIFFLKLIFNVNGKAIVWHTPWYIKEEQAQCATKIQNPKNPLDPLNQQIKIHTSYTYKLTLSQLEGPSNKWHTPTPLCLLLNLNLFNFGSLAPNK